MYKLTNQCCLLTCLTLAATLVVTTATAEPYIYNVKKIRRYQCDFVDTIPLTVMDGRLYVPVTSGGQEYLFLLDTGNGLGEIHADGHLRPQKRLGEKTFFDFNGTTRTQPVVTMPPFQIGHLELGNFPVSLADRPLPRTHEGVLGFALFNCGLAAKIDVHHQHLILTDRKKFFRAEEGIRLKYKLYGYTPQVTISPFEGYDVDAVFDTGNPHLFLFDRTLRESWVAADTAVCRQVTERREEQRLRSAYGIEKQGEATFFTLDRLAWAHFHLRHVKGRTKQGMSNLGVRFLRHGALIIDPFRKELVFQPYGGVKGEE